MKYILCTVALCCCLALPSRAQTTPASTVYSPLVDNALSTLQMNQSDVWLPWDAVDDDVHRLDIVKELFGTPLRTFDVTDDYAQRVQTDVPVFLQSLLPTLKLGKYSHYDYKHSLSAAEIDRKLGIELDTLTGLVETVVLRQYLAALIESSDAIARARTQLDSAQYAILLTSADSLLLSSEESSNSNVYELKQAEVEGERKAKEFFDAANTTSLLQIYNSGINLYQYYSELIKLSVSLRDLYTDNIKTIVLNTRYGKIAIGGKGNDVYNDDFVFILDAGGDDIYALPSYSKAQAIKNPVRCIIDLQGNDTYRGGDFSLASGFFGVGLLFDAGGNDSYTAGNFSLGSGLFGFGILEDVAGHDTYAGRTCTQGSGAFGIGLLLDRAGNDLYRCETQAQGFGYTRGFGALADFLGNDSYITISPFQDFLRYDDHFVAFTQGAALGARPIASGGIGMLFDYQGNDTYTSDIFGQGASYWFALAGLYDAQGNDHYTAFQYAQGAGTHLCVAALHDKAGNDHYYSHGVSQGCGHDIAFGGLLDEAGDDEYVVESLSLGGGNANAISLFVDKTGDDAYIARNKGNTMGFSDFRREYGMIGMFIDGGGTDLYADTLGNNTSTTKSTYGVFADLAMYPKQAPTNDVPALTPPEEQRDPLAGSIDSLFIQGAAAPQKFQYNVGPARKKIMAMGNSALPFLATKLNTSSARERHEMEYLLQEMHKADSTGAVRKFLLDSLASNDPATFSMCATIVGKEKIDGALNTLLSRLRHPRWGTRATAVMQIGKIGKPVALDSLLPLLDDEHPHVRMRAAYAFGLLLPDSLFPLVQRIMREDNQLVRNSFANGVRYRTDTLFASFLMSLINNAPNLRAKHALLPLAEKAVFLPEHHEQYQQFIGAQLPNIRQAFYATLQKAKDSTWLQAAGMYKALEPDEHLRSVLPDVEAPSPKEKRGKKKKKKKKSAE